jgi:hypothetical protein
MKKIILIMLLTACGTKEATEALNAAQVQDKTPTEQTISFAVSVKSDLPDCNLNIDNQLAYVRETAEFYTCDSEAWSKISIRGKDGEDGTDGVDGLAGSNGANGVNGVNGVNGTNGTNGTNGVSAYQPKVATLAGLELGRLVTIDNQTNRYWLIRDDGTRLEIARDGSLFASNYFYYSGLNCTGERRMVRSNGQWANTAFNDFDDKIYRQGSAYTTFTYLSRATSTCTNTSGTAARAFTVTEVTLAGYGSWGEVEIID